MPDKEYRAILTEREREIISREVDVDDKYYYRVISRVRDKISRLDEDLEILEQHREDLAEELRDTLCDQNES